MAAPRKECAFWWLREPMEKVLKEMSLLEVCRRADEEWPRAGCVRGRKSINDWLYVREDGPRDEKGNPIKRALPLRNTVPLGMFLCKHYPHLVMARTEVARCWLTIKKLEAKELEEAEAESILLDMQDEWQKRHKKKEKKVTKKAP
jgi:hypothetical protein